MGSTAWAQLTRGAAAGLIAGIVSSLPGLVWVLTMGEAWWRPVQLIASLVGVVQDAEFSLGAFLLGGAIHLLLSAGYGAVFGLAFHAVRDRTILIAGGIWWGLVLFAGNFGLGAALGWFDLLRAETNDAVEFAAHFAYGLVLGGVMRVGAGRRVGLGSGPQTNVDDMHL